MTEFKQFFSLDEKFSKISTGFFDDINDIYITGHNDGSVVYWKEISTKKNPKILCTLEDEITSIDFLTDNQLLIVSHSGEIVIYNFATKNSDYIDYPTNPKLGRKWRVLGLDDNSFLTGGTYGKLLYWIKVNNQWESQDIYAYREGIFGLSKLNDRLFATGSYSGRLVIWESTEENPKINQTINIGFNIRQIKWYDENTIAVIGREGNFAYLERDLSKNEFKVLKEFSISFNLGMDISFSSDGKYIIAGTVSEIILYDLNLDDLKKIDFKGCIALNPHNNGIYILTKNSLKYINLSDITIEVEKIEFKYQKISLIGHTGVGKSTLCNILTKSEESQIYSTVGKKTWKWVLEDKEKFLKKIYLQDLGGQESALTTFYHYILDSDIILVLFKQTQISTFEGALKIIKKINEIKANSNIYLIQSFIDHDNNVVKFEDFNEICSAYSIKRHLKYSFDNEEAIDQIKEVILDSIDWNTSKIVIQSKIVSKVIDLLYELKKQEKFSSIELDKFQEMLSKEIKITKPHLKYILKNLSNQGIIEYFPDFLNKIIFNELDYNQLKMNIPIFAKNKGGIFNFNDLINILSNNIPLKQAYIMIIDQIHESFGYNIQIGDKRIYPTLLKTKNVEINGFEFNEEKHCE